MAACGYQAPSPSRWAAYHCISHVEPLSFVKCLDPQSEPFKRGAVDSKASVEMTEQCRKELEEMVWIPDDSPIHKRSKPEVERVEPVNRIDVDQLESNPAVVLNAIKSREEAAWVGDLINIVYNARAEIKFSSAWLQWIEAHPDVARALVPGDSTIPATRPDPLFKTLYRCAPKLMKGRVFLHGPDKCDVKFGGKMIPIVGEVHEKTEFSFKTVSKPSASIIHVRGRMLDVSMRATKLKWISQKLWEGSSAKSISIDAEGVVRYVPGDYLSPSDIHSILHERENALNNLDFQNFDYDYPYYAYALCVSHRLGAIVPTRQVSVETTRDHCLIMRYFEEVAPRKLLHGRLHSALATVCEMAFEASDVPKLFLEDGEEEFGHEFPLVPVETSGLNSSQDAMHIEPAEPKLVPPIGSEIGCYRKIKDMFPNSRIKFVDNDKVTEFYVDGVLKMRVVCVDITKRRRELYAALQSVYGVKDPPDDVLRVSEEPAVVSERAAVALKRFAESQSCSSTSGGCSSLPIAKNLDPDNFSDARAMDAESIIVAFGFQPYVEGSLRGGRKIVEFYANPLFFESFFRKPTVPKEKLTTVLYAGETVEIHNTWEVASLDVPFKSGESINLVTSFVNVLKKSGSRKTDLSESYLVLQRQTQPYSRNCVVLPPCLISCEWVSYDVHGSPSPPISVTTTAAAALLHRGFFMSYSGGYWLGGIGVGLDHFGRIKLAGCKVSKCFRKASEASNSPVNNAAFGTRNIGHCLLTSLAAHLALPK